MGALTATIACIVAAGGCGGESPQDTVPTVPVERFAVSYERSGGLGPGAETLVVRPGRRAVATAGGSGRELRTARFRLSVLTVKRLRNALADPRWPTLPSSAGPGSCADCYVYAIAYRAHAVALRQDDVPDWLRKTVVRFEALVAHHLPLH